jgi:broad specificity phosphatase PhoE
LLKELNGQEMKTLIDDTSYLDIDICNPDENDDEESNEFPALVLLDYHFPKLHMVRVEAEDYVRFNERWKSFLKELFHRSSNTVVVMALDTTTFSVALKILQ